MSKVSGPLDSVLAARALDDAASGLVKQAAPCIACGKVAGLDVADDAADLVTCKACGQTQSALGVATLRVYREKRNKDGTAECQCTDDTAAKVATAKADVAKADVAKAPKDAKGVPVVDATTAKLAACTVTADPKPADGGKEVTIK